MHVNDDLHCISSRWNITLCNNKIQGLEKPRCQEHFTKRDNLYLGLIRIPSLMTGVLLKLECDRFILSTVTCGIIEVCAHLFNQVVVRFFLVFLETFLVVFPLNFAVALAR